MRAKGTALKSAKDFVLKYHPEKYDGWLNSLPERSKILFNNPIVVSQWYDIHYGVVLPTQSLAKMVFDSDIRAASWQIGRFSSEQALNGMLRFILKIPNITFVVGKASQLLSSYYDEATVIVDEKSKNHIKAIYSNLDGDTSLVYYRIAGWLENTLQSINLKDLKIQLEVTDLEGRKVGVLTMDWS